MDWIPGLVSLSPTETPSSFSVLLMREWKPKAVELVGWIACHSLRIVNGARDGRKKGGRRKRPTDSSVTSSRLWGGSCLSSYTTAAFNPGTLHSSIDSDEPRVVSDSCNLGKLRFDSFILRSLSNTKAAVSGHDSCGRQFNRLFIGLIFGPRIGTSFGQSVKLMGLYMYQLLK